MNLAEWFAYATEHRQELIALLADFHPTNRLPGTRHSNASNDYHGDYITAPNAEAACVQVRRRIRDEQATEKPATIRLSEAIDNKEYHKVVSLLNDAWFGVPESRGSWGIIGFEQAVILLENPPTDL